MNDTIAEASLSVIVADARWHAILPEPETTAAAALRAVRACLAADGPARTGPDRRAENAAQPGGQGSGQGGDHGEVTILLGDDGELQALNARYRGVDRPTNVLAFAYDDGESRDATVGAMPLPPIGDIALARETCEREAADQGKRAADHATHLIIHGYLHLLGYDHQDPAEAEIMETLERRVLESLNIGDPYGDGAPP
jgi:probable rRNA maturation factor